MIAGKAKRDLWGEIVQSRARIESSIRARLFFVGSDSAQDRFGIVHWLR